MEKIKTVFSLSKPSRLVFMYLGDKGPDTSMESADQGVEKKDLKDLPLKDKLELAKNRLPKVVEGLTDEEHAKAMEKIEGWLKENPEASTINFKEYIKVVAMEAARQIMIANNKKEEEKKEVAEKAMKLESARKLITSEKDSEDARFTILKIGDSEFTVANDVAEEVTNKFAEELKGFIGLKDSYYKDGNLTTPAKQILNDVVKTAHEKSKINETKDKEDEAKRDEKIKKLEAMSTERIKRADTDASIKEAVGRLPNQIIIGPIRKTGIRSVQDSYIDDAKKNALYSITRAFKEELGGRPVTKDTGEEIKEWVNSAVSKGDVLRSLRTGGAVTLDFSKAKKDLFVKALDNREKADAQIAAVEKAKPEVVPAPIPVVTEVAVEKPAQVVAEAVTTDQKVEAKVVTDPASVEAKKEVPVVVPAPVEPASAEKAVVAEGEKAVVAEGEKAVVAEGEKAVVAEGEKAVVAEGEKAVAVEGEKAPAVVAEVSADKPADAEKTKYDADFERREAEKLADPLAMIEATSSLNAVKKILADHKSYKLGDWKAVNNELATIAVKDMNDQTLTDEKAASIVSTLQKQLSEKEGVNIGETDGKAGPKTLKALAKYLGIDAKKVRPTSDNKGGEKGKESTNEVSKESPKEEFYALSLGDEVLSNVLNSEMTKVLASYNKTYPAAFNIEAAEGGERKFFKKVVGGKDAETYVATDVKIKDVDYTFQIRVNTINDNILVDEGGGRILELNDKGDLAKYVKRIKDSFSNNEPNPFDVTMPSEPTQSSDDGHNPFDVTLPPEQTQSIPKKAVKVNKPAKKEPTKPTEIFDNVMTPDQPTQSSDDGHNPFDVTLPPEQTQSIPKGKSMSEKSNTIK